MIRLLPHYHKVSLTIQQNGSTHRGNFYWEMRAFPFKLWLGRSTFVPYPWLRSTWREPWYIKPLPLCPLVCSFISEYMTWFILNHRFRRSGPILPLWESNCPCIRNHATLSCQLQRISHQGGVLGLS